MWLQNYCLKDDTSSSLILDEDEDEDEDEDIVKKEFLIMDYIEEK
jgi:hypothetical protein